MYQAVIAAVLVVLFDRRPQIDSIEPAHGLPEGGTVVTIRGHNLATLVPPATAPRTDCTPCPARPPQVLFGGKNAEVQSYAEDTLVVKTPPNAGGVYDVQVDNSYFGP